MAFENIKDSIISGFQAVGEFIVDGVKALFIPDQDNVDLKTEEIRSYFGFVDGIKQTINEINTFFTNIGDGDIPKISVNLSRAEGKYNYGTNAMVLDMTWYARYKPFCDVIIIAFVYITFLFNIFRRLPDIISGSGAVIMPVIPSKGTYSQIDYMIEDKGGKK